MKNKFLPFSEAKKIVLTLKLKSNLEWRTYCKSEKRNLKIPVHPDRTYKGKGWKNWPDWLGTNTKSNKNPLLKLDRTKVKEILSERFLEKVNQNNGQVIKGIYINKHSVFSLRCKHGHEWETQAQNILAGTWCRKCFNKERAGKHLILKNGLEQAIQIATERKGKCLSTKYINSQSKLIWECNNGHIWNAVLNDIKKGTWCPYCGKGIRERLCRSIFEQITSYKFPKKRPKWLINVRGNRMELDGYCEELKIAFEHHGEYHYKQNKHFQRRKETLERRKLDDKTKVDLCKINNIILVIIPYFIETTELKTFIFNKLFMLNLGITLNENINDKYVVSNELEELNQIAIQKGGKCLSNIYLGVNQKHKFICAEDHVFNSLPSNIKSKRKSWCPTCKPNRIGNSNRKYSVSDMQNIARKKNGLFLSTFFKSVNHKYLWQCEQGHQWKAAPMDIIKGTWCKKCSFLKKKGSISEMQKIAGLRNGKCISTEYVSSQSKLIWECEFGHQWEARPDNIKNSKSWCPHCSRKKKRSKK
ncbi:MAG: hypothetical protein AB8G11_22800 [Saprospiraceae bacterium]